VLLAECGRLDACQVRRRTLHRYFCAGLIFMQMTVKLTVQTQKLLFLPRSASLFFIAPEDKRILFFAGQINDRVHVCLQESLVI
jgi:hypothetical protein